MGFLHRKLDHFSFEEYLVIFVLCTVLLPFYCSIIAMVGVIGYLFYKKRMKEILDDIPFSKVVILANIISFIVSMIAENYLGAACSVMVLFIFLFIC